MNMSRHRATFAVISALAMLSPTTSSLAQQQTAPAAQQTPALSQAPAIPAQAAPPVQAPASSAAAPSAPAPVASDATVAPADGGRLLKSTAVALRELSPWSMFLSADVLVKAVMIGLAFASLVTWTIFIAKMIELSLIQRKLRRALAMISDARSLAEAQFALGARRNVLSALLSASMREARLSAGISSDSGIKERAASSFAEIVRAEARRVRLGVGHHEQLYRHLEIADHQSCRGCAGYRGGAARHRAGSGRGDPGRHHLQSFRARDEGLPRTGRPGVGRRRAIVVARPRSHPWCDAFARGGVGDGRLIGRHRTR